jgi:hypothetical protein
MLEENKYAHPEFQNWEGLAIKKHNGEIFYRNYSGYETRNESTLKLIYESIQEYGVNDFDWVMINTGDYSQDHINNGQVTDINGQNFLCFSYSTQSKKHYLTIPDFVFDHWKQTGLDDYESTRNQLKRFDVQKPESDLLGWRGANTNKSREKLVSLDDKLNFDCEFISWDRSNPEKLTAVNFLSFQEQINKWRFLIDMEGVGYSGRLKLFLASPRAVFIQERPHEEYFFDKLIPWVHYIPVQNDLSDLNEKVEMLKSDTQLEQEIIQNQQNFSQLYLTRDYAKFYLAHTLSALVG